MTEAMKQLSEKDLQSSVVEVLRWKGWLCYHTHDSRRSQPGFPDLVAVRGSTLIFVEFKTEKGKVKDEQHDWLTRLSLAHGDVFLVRPSTMDSFVDWIEGDQTGLGLKAHWNNQPEARDARDEEGT